MDARQGLAVLAGIGLFGCASTPDAVLTRIPGTKIRIAIPAGFEFANDFVGLSNGRGASIAVMEWPRSQTDTLAEFDGDQLAARGLALVATDSIEVASGRHPLLRIDRVVPDGFARSFLLLGDAESTSIVAATSPANGEVDELARALASARRDADRAIPTFEGLGFEFDAGEWRAVRTRQIVQLRPSADTGPGSPVLIAGRARVGDVADLVAFSGRRLARTPGIDSIEIASQRSFELDGLPAVELVAQSLDHGSRVTFCQTIALDGSRYFLMQGRVDSARSERYLPEFRKIVATFRRVD